MGNQTVGQVKVSTKEIPVSLRNFILRPFNFWISTPVRLIYIAAVLPFKQNINVPTVLEILQRQANTDAANYAKAKMQSALLFDQKQGLWSFAIKKMLENFSENHIDQTLIKENIIVAEFGVWKGESITFFAKRLNKIKVIGFDSFEGLEEDWSGTSLSKNYFDLHGLLPRVPENVSLFKGWFNETLPKYLQVPSNSSEMIGICHLDADTYSATHYVLNSLKTRFTKGTIIIFDEYFGYPFWENGEFKAFQEFIEENKMSYKYLAIGVTQVVVELS
jgi:hypothetical protein